MCTEFSRSTRRRTVKESNSEANKLKKIQLTLREKFSFNCRSDFAKRRARLRRINIFRFGMASNTFVPRFKKIHFSGSKLKRCEVYHCFKADHSSTRMKRFANIDKLFRNWIDDEWRETVNRENERRRFFARQILRDVLWILRGRSYIDKIYLSQYAPWKSIKISFSPQGNDSNALLCGSSINSIRHQKLPERFSKQCCLLLQIKINLRPSLNFPSRFLSNDDWGPRAFHSRHVY